MVVAVLLLAQRLHTISHRYDQFDFVVFHGWWTDYSSGGDPWTDQRGPMRGCNYTPAFIEIFSPLARIDQQTAFWIWQAAQILCMVVAVLLLARGSASPLGPAPTIIVLHSVRTRNKKYSHQRCRGGRTTQMLGSGSGSPSMVVGKVEVGSDIQS